MPGLGQGQLGLGGGGYLGGLVVGGREKTGEEATGTTRLDTMFVLPYSLAWAAGGVLGMLTSPRGILLLNVVKTSPT